MRMRKTIEVSMIALVVIAGMVAVDTIAGDYDLVLDTCQDGYYNAVSYDVEDCRVAGFTVVPESAILHA